MSIFDISINLFESFTIMLFIFLLYGKEHKYKYLLLTIFTLWSFALITYNDIYTLEPITFTLLDVLLCYIYTSILNKNKLILNLFIASLPGMLLSIVSAPCIIIVNSIYHVFSSETTNIALLAITTRTIFFITIVFFSRVLHHIQTFNKKLTWYATISIWCLAAWYAKIVNSLFPENTTSLILYFEIFVITLLAFFIIMIFRESKREQKRILEQQLIITELHDKEKQYNDITLSIEQTNRLKHDLKHVVYSTLSSLKENNIVEAKDTLEKQINSINSIGTHISTGNKDLDYILNHRYLLLQQKDIELHVSNFEGIIPVEKVDFFIFMGNLIDNAIENCQNNPTKKILITNGKVGSYYYIKIQNTILHSVLKTNPHLETTKSNKSIHGIGIKSTYQLLDKYDAKLEFSEDSMYFCAKIIIPLNDN